MQHEVGRAVDLKLRGTAYKVTVAPDRPAAVSGSASRPAAPSSVVDADVERLDEFHSRLTVGGQRYRLVTATHGPVHLVEVDGVAHRVSRDEGGVLRSPAPALVVASPVAVGDEVAAGAPVLVLESMKMETVLRAPFAAPGPRAAGRRPAARSRPARRWCASSRSPTTPATTAAAAEAAPADLDLPGAAADGLRRRARRAALGRRCAAMLLGFDVDPSDERRASSPTTSPPATSSSRPAPTCVRRRARRCSACSPTSPS